MIYILKIWLIIVFIITALPLCFLAWKQVHKENIYMNCIHEAHGQGTCAYLIEVVNK